MKTTGLTIGYLAALTLLGSISEAKTITINHDGLPRDRSFQDLQVTHRQLGNGGSWVAARIADGVQFGVQFWSAGSTETAVSDCTTGWPTMGLNGRMLLGSYSGRKIGNRVWRGYSPSGAPTLVAVQGKLVYSAWISETGNSSNDWVVQSQIPANDWNELEDLLINAIHNE